MSTRCGTGSTTTTGSPISSTRRFDLFEGLAHGRRPRAARDASPARRGCPTAGSSCGGPAAPRRPPDARCRSRRRCTSANRAAPACGAPGGGSTPKTFSARRCTRRRTTAHRARPRARAAIEQRLEQLSGAGRHGRATGRVVEHHQLPPLRVGQVPTGLGQHEHRPQVVPRSEGAVGAVDGAVDPAVGDAAQIERRRTERPVLPPAQVRRRVPVEHHQRVGDRRDAPTAASVGRRGWPRRRAPPGTGCRWPGSPPAPPGARRRRRRRGWWRTRGCRGWRWWSRRRGRPRPPGRCRDPPDPDSSDRIPDARRLAARPAPRRRPPGRCGTGPVARRGHGCRRDAARGPRRAPRPQRPRSRRAHPSNSSSRTV